MLPLPLQVAKDPSLQESYNHAAVQVGSRTGCSSSSTNRPMQVELPSCCSGGTVGCVLDQGVG